MKSRKRGPAGDAPRAPTDLLAAPLRPVHPSSNSACPPTPSSAPLSRLGPASPAHGPGGIPVPPTCSPQQCPPTPSSAPLTRRCPLASPARGRPRAPPWARAAVGRPRAPRRRVAQSVAVGSKGYYEIVSFVLASRSPLLPAWLTAPRPSFGLPFPEPRSVRAGVNSRVTASFTSPISTPIAFPGLAAGEAGHSPRGARRAVPNSRFLGFPRGAAAYNGNWVRAQAPSAGAASRDPRPRERERTACSQRTAAARSGGSRGG